MNLGYNKIKSALKDKPEASVLDMLPGGLHKSKWVFLLPVPAIMKAIYLYH